MAEEVGGRLLTRDMSCIYGVVQPIKADWLIGSFSLVLWTYFMRSRIINTLAD